MSTRKWSAGAAAGLALLALALSLRSPAAPAGAEPAPAAGTRPSALAGVVGCSARACHGGAEPSPGAGAQQNEYSTWLAHDRHARAFAVLGEERGRRMAANLGIADAQKDARCLACHTYPAAAVGAGADLEGLRAEGVGCEACHGGAHGTTPWLEAYTGGDWKKLSGADKEQKYGFVPLADLTVQARTCAGCHVGAPADAAHGWPARDLNHDLMAAGHPRLTFEFAAFRANMPPHWREQRYNQQDPGHPARVWAVGQAATALAAVELLRSRVSPDAAHPRDPWPEFCEYDCFACHASFREANWRKEVARGPAELGKLRYSVWHSALLPVLSDGLRAPFEELARTMNQPLPGQPAVAAQADKLIPMLQRLAIEQGQKRYDPAGVRSLLGKLAGREPDVAKMTWDELEQLVLAVDALHRADRALAGAGPGTKDEVAGRLRGLFEALAFPSPFESPARSKDDKAARAELRALLGQLTSR